MSYQYPNLIWQSSTTSGTGTITLTGSSPVLRTFESAFGTAARVFYRIRGADYFEFGFGDFDSVGPTLTRDEVILSSTANALVDLPAGTTHDVIATFPGEPWNVDSFSGTSHAAAPEDHGNVKVFTGAAACTVAPDRPIAEFPAGFMVKLMNAGSAPMTIDPDGSEQIRVNNGAAASTAILQPGESGDLFRHGTLWRLRANRRAALGHGACRLVLSGGNLILLPMNGNGLQIAGTIEAIPTGGISLSATGASSGTTYFIYAYMSSGTMTLEFSATGHATDTVSGNIGVETKSGDTSRTLVGMARAVAGPNWADSAAQRFVVSFFNRRDIAGANHFTADRTTTAASWAELNAEIRCEFLAWADEAVRVSFTGSLDGTGALTGFLGIGFDGATPEEAMVRASGEDDNFSASLIAAPLSEGYHYATVIGETDGVDQITCKVWSNAPGERTAITIGFRG